MGMTRAEVVTLDRGSELTRTGPGFESKVLDSFPAVIAILFVAVFIVFKFIIHPVIVSLI